MAEFVKVMAELTAAPREAQLALMRQGDLMPIALLRLLVVDLAIRAFHRANGHLPRELDLLAPIFLPAIPTDPYNDQPLHYQARRRDYVLYSSGPEGTDFGGRCGPRWMVNAGKADLCLIMDDCGDSPVGNVLLDSLRRVVKRFMPGRKVNDQRSD